MCRRIRSRPTQASGSSSPTSRRRRPASFRHPGVAIREIAAIEEEVEDLIDDESFWRYQSRSLAAFATPEALTTIRLPSRLATIVEASDRFHLKPLLRAVTFPR